MALETNVYLTVFGLLAWAILTIVWAYRANRRDGLSVGRGMGFFDTGVDD